MPPTLPHQFTVLDSDMSEEWANWTVSHKAGGGGGGGGYYIIDVSNQGPVRLSLVFAIVYEGNHDILCSSSRAQSSVDALPTGDATRLRAVWTLCLQAMLRFSQC